MKNQYYGDISDYKKYSLIRLLTGGGEIRTAICWELTEDDALRDGGRVNYLRQPLEWRKYDPVVFDWLREDVLIKGERKVENVEKSKIFSNCIFFDQLLKDSDLDRKRFFQEFSVFSQGADLIFFDPDNGIEVKSVPRGKNNSSKYIYWHELRQFYQSGKSLLIYQHFPRRNRKHYVDDIVSKVFKMIGPSAVFEYLTSNVLFLLVPQENQEAYYRGKNRLVVRNWKDLIKVKENSIHHGYSRPISIYSTAPPIPGSLGFNYET
jgi:hypothetical protein